MLNQRLFYKKDGTGRLTVCPTPPTVELVYRLIFLIHWQGHGVRPRKFTRRVSKIHIEAVYGDVPVTLPLPGVLPVPALRKVYSLT